MDVSVRNKHLYTLRFADDQVVIAQDKVDLRYVVTTENKWLGIWKEKEA